MLTAKVAAFSNAKRLNADFARLQRMRGGSSETEVKELAVTPIAEPSSDRVVMMVTPVTKDPSAVRSARAVLAVGAGACLSGGFGEVMAPVYCFSYFMSNRCDGHSYGMLMAVRSGFLWHLWSLPALLELGLIWIGPRGLPSRFKKIAEQRV
jgi:hypothetical protein